MTTPKNVRRPPTQAFSEYTLSRIASPEIGLTNIPYGRMTQVIDANVDDGEATVDLGQRFTFDGINYGRAVVSSNGYLTLGVDTLATIMTSSVSNNALIPVGDITASGSVLIAPWFNDIQTAQSTNAGHPGVWFAYDNGPDGVRSVFRWVCQNCITSVGQTPRYVLMFECVLRSNGEVQFRYAPPVDAGVLLESSLAARGATIGIFTTGSQRFRDFARDNTHLGGAVYSPSYTDPSSATSYTTSLMSNIDFPALRFGALYSFQPRRLTYRAVPRLDLRARDQRQSTFAGSHPGTRDRRVRTSLFDDRKSIAFTSGVVNYPTTLPRWIAAGTPHGRSLEAVYTQIDVTASVSRSGVEAWLGGLDWTGPPTTPFNEIGLPEQDSPTGTFFSTGTQPSDVPGLSAPLRSKTIVRMDLPVDFVTALAKSTASLYYYDAGSSRISLTASGSRQSPASVTVLAGDAQLFGPLGHSLVSGSYGTSGSIDIAPYQASHPYAGMPVSKTVIEAAMQFVQTGSATLDNEHDPAVNGIVPIPAALFIDRPFIIEKAVIEFPFMAGPGWFNDRTRTVLFDVPTGASPTVPLEFAADMGGPCITIGIMNCLSPVRRDIILSGTVIPVGDAVAQSTFTYFATASGGSATIYEHTIEGFNGYGGRATAVVTPNSSNGTQFTGTVRLEVDARVLNGYLALSNGKNYYTVVSSSDSYLASELGKTTVDLTSTSPGAYFLHSIEPFGRSMSGFDPSGRSVFGKEHVAPTYARNTVYGVQNPFVSVQTQALAQLASSALFTGSYNVLANAAMFVGGSRTSPYLITPSDRLALFVAKHRPARSSTVRSQGGTFASMHAGANAGALTGSHDVQVGIGTIRVALYGSHIANGIEHHDVLQQSLVTDAAMETIAGGEPVTDQFEIEYKMSMSGSTFDAYVTGALVSRPGAGDNQDRLVIGPRERAFSILNARAAGIGSLSNGSMTQKLVPSWELAGDIRNVQCTSQTERFYDSMLPAYDAIAHADGTQIVTYTDAPNLTGSWVFLDASGSAPGSVPHTATDGVWSWAYPFEQRYAGIARQDDVTRSMLASGTYDGTNIVESNAKVTGRLINVAAATRLQADSNLIDYVVVTDFVSGTALLNAANAPGSDVIKALYGFGDNNLRRQFGTLYFVGPTHFPTFRQMTQTTVNRSDLQYSVSPIIRGWKHGLINGLPYYSRATFRRGRFGQFRDMLEQRYEAKYFITSDQGTQPGSRRLTAMVTAGPVTVQFLASPRSGSAPVPVKPWLTTTSNASVEATSSLPYFDGLARN